MVDPISYEVEKYHRKKDRLTQGFINKMKAIISTKEQSITHTDEVMAELQVKREEYRNELDRARLALNSV